MPSTVNGIGTHYYGKKNVQSRPGVCQFCRRDSILSSYDTRLWFVVVFIPVIPLGRKRILDYCPHCTRHRVMALAEWEKIKQKNLTEVMEGMKTNPHDPKAAIKLHGALVAFGQLGEAEKVTALMKERFAGDAETQAYLGSSLQYLGKDAEAVPYFRRALELNPELPEAKVAVALDLVGKGKLDEARALLKFLEAPGTAQAPGALYALANGYQSAGRQKEALELYHLLMERFPKLAQDKSFRKAVQRAETAAGGVSKLPPREIRWKPLAAVGAALGVGVIVALGSNHHISQHRTLYVVGDLPKSVTLQIGGQRVVMARRGVSTLTLPEGKYQAAIPGAKQEKVDFEIRSGFWTRWFRDPVYILNVDGSALLIQENVTYSARPEGGGSDYAFHFGQLYWTVPDVDYAFQPVPDSIRVDSRSSAVRKSRIDLFEGPAQEAFLMQVTRSRIADALGLAEWYLPSHPGESEFLSLYVYAAQRGNQAERARAFLAEGAKRRPIEISWHRAYQETRAYGTNGPALVAEYDTLLKAEPTNAALLYLRGRICTRQHEAIAFYEKALAGEPTNAYAHYALGQNLLAGSDWDSAFTHLSEAARLRPDNLQFQEGFIVAHFALKKYDELEAALRKSLTANPMDLNSAENLGLTYIVQNTTNDLDKLVRSVRQQLQRERSSDGDDGMTSMQTYFLYAQGRFEELEKMSVPRRAGQPAPGRFIALVELGKLADAAAMVEGPGSNPADAFDLLALSVAARQAGDDALADRMRAQAIERLMRSRFEYLATAELLKRETPVPLAELMDVSLQPVQKALLLTVQGQRFAEGRAEVYAAARRLNFMRQFPYHLINRVTGGAEVR